MRIPIPFLGGTAEARSKRANNQRTVNLYADLLSPGSKSIIALNSVPGNKDVGTVGTGPGRSNFIEFDNHQYSVSGSELIKLDRFGNATSVGNINTIAGRVVIVAGRNYVALVDGEFGYTFDGTTFAQIADPDFPENPTHITYLDGYFIVNSGDDAYISASENPTSWGALDFTTAEAAPDDVKAVEQAKRSLHLIGERTTQVYFNSGNLDFPFDLYPNGVLDVGAEAPYSVASAGDEGLFFVARDQHGGKFVVNMAGIQVQKISDAERDASLQSFTVTDDAIGWIERWMGHKFYVLTFPSASRTYAYDMTTGLWHDRKGYGLDRSRLNGHGYFAGSHWACDYLTGALYEYDFDHFQDGDLPLERIRRGQYIHKDGRHIQVNEFIVEFEPGTAKTTGQGEDPQAMLRYSVDGGNEWSYGLWASIGKVGKYKRAVVWDELGEGPSFLFEVMVTDPIDVSMIAAYADIEVLAF